MCYFYLGMGVCREQSLWNVTCLCFIYWWFN